LFLTFFAVVTKIRFGALALIKADVIMARPSVQARRGIALIYFRLAPIAGVTDRALAQESIRS